jgi:Tol biopolymer transport system component
MHLGRRYKERTDTGCSERKNLGAPFEGILIMRLTASAEGTYVFDEIVKDGKGGYEDGPIRSSRLVDGKREKPRVLSKAINTGKQNSHPFIAPDESYIIWDSQRDGGYGDSDIYISYRQQDGAWGAAINMGDKINTAGWDAAASVTPDGKYILFNRYADAEGGENVDIYWVDAQIIETLRPKE